jgi:chemotaxis protein MotA
MDLGTLGGIGVGALLIIILGIGPANIPLFIDVPSVAIVVGGTLSSVFTAYPMTVVKQLVAVLKVTIFPPSQNYAEVVKQIVSFAEQARREGILALEARTQEIEDEYLKKGVQLAVDGTEPDLIRDIMETELGFIEERHKKYAGVMGYIGMMGPAFGMIGTLVGLVLMLANMADPAAIGPAMAVALLTTMYGSVLANMFFIPFESKLGAYSGEELLAKQIMLEGIMSLQAGENPRTIEMKLSSFLDPETRLQVSDKEE